MVKALIAAGAFSREGLNNFLRIALCLAVTIGTYARDYLPVNDNLLAIGAKKAPTMAMKEKKPLSSAICLHDMPPVDLGISSHGGGMEVEEGEY